MAQTTNITVKQGDDKWVYEIGAQAGGPMKIRLKVPWIIGNWGYNAGEVVTVNPQMGQSLLRNGKAEMFTELEPEPEPVKAPEAPKRKPGWPKGKPRKPRSGRL